MPPPSAGHPADSERQAGMANPVEDEEALKAILEEVVGEVRSAAPDLYKEAVAEAAEYDKPAPRKGDFEKFGIAVHTRTGLLVTAGNACVGFPIQSISKVFALELALAALGEKLWKRLGREPSRSEERRVGKECGRRCRAGGWPA